MALVSYDCQNKVQQTGWLKMEIYSLTVLESRSPKSRCWHSCVLSESSGGGLFFASS